MEVKFKKIKKNRDESENEFEIVPIDENGNIINNYKRDQRGRIYINGRIFTHEMIKERLIN
ncbi:MAG: hypothetical protein FXF47_06035 [Candidatus Mcinerneyibacterium aminivorans]|uniref:Uncharacterized protein n=1 Tax=Candidatus Mcinerneyibacterium aminivorans TaxID=2703815 RepID=A0A5D0MHJ5_9BACT|nr:MAG: hypothetical protein FXF47_06035 [Candidatus Mcinerneyibacterium aminivorans]